MPDLNPCNDHLRFKTGYFECRKTIVRMSRFSLFKVTSQSMNLTSVLPISQTCVHVFSTSEFGAREFPFEVRLTLTNKLPSIPEMNCFLGSDDWCLMWNINRITETPQVDSNVHSNTDLLYEEDHGKTAAALPVASVTCDRYKIVEHLVSLYVASE